VHVCNDCGLFWPVEKQSLTHTHTKKGSGLHGGVDEHPGDKANSLKRTLTTNGEKDKTDSKKGQHGGSSGKRRKIDKIEETRRREEKRPPEKIAEHEESVSNAVVDVSNNEKDESEGSEEEEIQCAPGSPDVLGSISIEHTKTKDKGEAEDGIDSDKKERRQVNRRKERDGNEDGGDEDEDDEEDDGHDSEANPDLKEKGERKTNLSFVDICTIDNEFKTIIEALKVQDTKKGKKTGEEIYSIFL